MLPEALLTCVSGERGQQVFWLGAGCKHDVREAKHGSLRCQAFTADHAGALDELDPIRCRKQLPKTGECVSATEQQRRGFWQRSQCAQALCRRCTHDPPIDFGHVQMRASV